MLIKFHVSYSHATRGNTNIEANRGPFHHEATVLLGPEHADLVNVKVDVFPLAIFNKTITRLRKKSEHPAMAEFVVGKW